MAPWRPLIAALAVAASSLDAAAQQPIPPVDFRPFSDGMHWIVREPLTYTIGISSDSITVPVGFVTDFASIPQALQSIIRANGPYILPAVVHDYLYWKQTCTRQQADQILLLGMIENQVREIHRSAIHGAVSVAGGFAWADNAKDREAGLVRILPADRMRVPVNTSWPDYRQRLKAEGVTEGPDTPVSPAVCARADLPTDEALTTR
jgi:hypothetical protein